MGSAVVGAVPVVAQHEVAVFGDAEGARGAAVDGEVGLVEWLAVDAGPAGRDLDGFTGEPDDPLDDPTA